MIIKIILIIIIFLLAGCGSNHSVLSPAGLGAEKIAQLFWWMCAGAIIIWLWLIVLGIYGMLVKPSPHSSKKTALFIISGGVVIPIIIISFLIFFTLPMIPPLVAKAPPGSLQIHVSGVQWWWRIEYPLSDGQKIELANEIRVPVNEYVQFNLSSEDVIHSFWIPAIGGKLDMIPGRKNHLALKANKVGMYKGFCAEYCGLSHAQMKLDFIVMERKDFDSWLNNQKNNYKEPQTEIAKKGKNLFLRYGCTACHSVRGLSSIGTIGPDLTHVGARVSLGAGVLSNQIESYHRWITKLQKLKPGVKMPSFEMLSKEDRQAIAIWLKSLE